MLIALSAVSVCIRRPLRLLVNEMIVGRYSSGGRGRNSAPEYKRVSDVIQGKMKEMDMTEKSPHVTRSEEMADKLRKETDSDMNEPMNMRTSHDSEEANRRQENVIPDKWVAIYRYDKIVAVRTFARFKIYQTFITTGMAGYALASHLLGNALRRVIGFVYLSEDKEWVKIAHTDFWGHRQDNVFRAKHLVPLRDYPGHPYARQLFISQPDFSDRYYFLPLKNGTFLDPWIFSEIFGIDFKEIYIQNKNEKTGSVNDDKDKEQEHDGKMKK